MQRLLLLATLTTLTACTSLAPPRAPAPVEDRDVPSTPAPPAERPVVGPPLPPDFDPNAPASRTPPQSAPQATPQRASPAASLLTQVEQAVAAGELERATALAERALGIAPRDPQVWYTLASVQFQQRRYADAEGSAQRALSFAGDNQPLRRTINTLLANIRSAR